MKRGLPLIALAACLLSAGCGDDALEQRIAELEKQLADEIELADAVGELRQVNEVAAATAILDQVDLQGLALKLAGDEPIAAVDVTSVLGASRALKHAEWPDYLLDESENCVESLDSLAQALRGRDRERALNLAPPAAAFQTEMRRATRRWLDAVAPWKRKTKPVHSHGPDSQHMDHDPRHEGVVGMWGDVHVEARIERDGRFHAWLTGPTRDPIAAVGVRGEVVLYPDTDQQARVPLMIGGEDFLMGRGKPIEGTFAHVTVKLQGTSEGDIEMDFSLPVRNASQR